MRLLLVVDISGKNLQNYFREQISKDFKQFITFPELFKAAKHGMFKI